jgi:hypothetical protein
MGTSDNTSLWAYCTPVPRATKGYPRTTRHTEESSPRTTTGDSGTTNKTPGTGGQPEGDSRVTGHGSTTAERNPRVTNKAARYSEYTAGDPRGLTASQISYYFYINRASINRAS